MRTPVLDLFRPAVWLGARLYFGIRFEGVENIPRDGALIITPNHVTYADPPLVSIPVRRPVYYMAWSALFRIPVFSWVIRRLRAFPVDIGSADPRATREAVRLLEAQQAVMIFPEAGRSHDGRLQRFRLGAFRLACSRSAPVLPVTIIGGSESWPPGRLLPRPGQVTIVYHPLIWPAGGDDVKGAAREMATKVHAAVLSALPPSLRAPGGE
ncbi:MAG: 1-acyl-sn-glycerol-3-phosphate acyltransferase [Candidatus Rokubacteria bacterium]|nr:1-acyl-sn-glycerol-3-phosphate acyltransferase [Candidatus Rokubacteria bacterium]MBI3104204.1 1-acyl-sn-glycerol-3-phosphate acyltransferase [Candidatus Rokubacteria bacterium]